MDVYLCAKSESEGEALRQFCVRYFIKQNYDAAIHHVKEPEEFSMVIKKIDAVSLFILDTEGRIIGMAGEIQQKNDGHYILLICSDLQSLAACIRPDLRPAGILLRPVKKRDLILIFDEIWRNYQDSQVQDRGERFVFSSGGEKMILPYQRILYFEAAAKKILVRTENQEFEFYGSMQTIEKSLPDCFLRVHRSYIVNMSKAETISFTENTITMEGDCLVVFSRNNREKLRQYLELRS